MKELEQIKFPAVAEKPVCWGSLADRGMNHRLNWHTCPDHKAIVDLDTGKTFAITTRHYNLIKHEDAIDTVERAIAQNPDFGPYDREINLLADGGKMEAVWTFPEAEYKIRKGDVVNPTINLYGSYDKGWKHKLLFGAFRVVCSNGLVVGEQFVCYERRHNQFIDQEEIQRILIAGMERFSEQTQLWKRWVDRVTTLQDYERAMDTLSFTSRETEEIEQEVEVSSDIRLDDIKTRTLTYWVFFNIIAQYITHKVENGVRRANLQGRMRQVFNN